MGRMVGGSMVVRGQLVACRHMTPDGVKTTDGLYVEVKIRRAAAAPTLTSTWCRSSISSISRSRLRSSDRRSSRSFFVISQNALILSCGCDTIPIRVWLREDEDGAAIRPGGCRSDRGQRRPSCWQRGDSCNRDQNLGAPPLPYNNIQWQHPPAPAACSSGTPPPCSSRAPA